MRGVDQKGVLTGALYFLFGAGTALGSLQYPIGSFWRMGAGFFPLMVSLALMLTGIVVAAVALAPAAPVALGRWPLRNLVLVTAAVVLFALLTRPAGVILAIAGLLAVASLAERGMRLQDVLISFLVLSALTWVVFIRLLGLQLSLFPPVLGL